MSDATFSPFHHALSGICHGLRLTPLHAAASARPVLSFAWLIGLVCGVLTWSFQLEGVGYSLFLPHYIVLACLLAGYGWRAWLSALVGMALWLPWSVPHGYESVLLYAAQAVCSVGVAGMLRHTLHQTWPGLPLPALLSAWLATMLPALLLIPAGLAGLAVVLYGAESGQWLTFTLAYSLPVLLLGNLWLSYVLLLRYQLPLWPAVSWLVWGAVVLCAVIALGGLWWPSAYFLLLPALAALSLSAPPLLAALVAATVLLVMLAGLLYVHVPISVLLSTPALEQAQIFLFVLGLTLHLTLLAVSLRRERERHRQASVYRDPATGMLNHAGLAKEFRRWHQVQRPFALAALNINLFESILIVFGSDTGARILGLMARKLEQELPAGWPTGRLLGGMYILMVPLDEALTLVELERIAEAVAEVRVPWESHFLDIRCNMVFLRQPSEDYEVSLHRATAAVQEAGARRLPGLMPAEQVYGEEIHAGLHWISRLQQALQEGRFTLFAQKILPLSPQTETGLHFEILLRLRDEAGKLVSPGEFIPAAEHFRMMPMLDHWVIASTIEWLANHPHYRQQVAKCALNLSGQTIVDASVVDFVHQSLMRHPIETDKLCFEITETSALGDLGRARALVQGLRGLGCKIALDDFGKGFSSFDYLKRLPADFLKIDGSFVRNLAPHSVDESIVKAMVDVAQATGLQTIAEYVETPALQAHLQQLGVDFAQGYGVARPMPLEQFFQQELGELADCVSEKN